MVDFYQIYGDKIGIPRIAGQDNGVISLSLNLPFNERMLSRKWILSFL